MRWAAAHGGYDPRSAPPLVRGWLRMSYEMGAALARIGVRSPNAVTVLGLLLSAAVPLTVAVPGGTGWAFAGAVLVLLSAIADTVDGVLAVVTGRATRLGQVYDSAADRIAEACWLVALVILGGPAWLAAGCCGVMWLHEYVRARATVAGMTDIGTVTVAERPTRVLITIFGLLAIAGAGAAGRWEEQTVLAVLVAMAVLTVAGFVQLIAAVRRALS
ncbi:CDP-alcohol phosphatidyltransferase family protein [Dactylosporangium sp. NBC_01737]|uniref:CDP-alcohol phosphatidyltransferase family protein n=1 Tax=Dactylosporangium sp. NBC_01737 TaxID=2975959 RepID=UPI002E13D5D9|nr:CDP-alcohol phosphatidyltransferase family protein [Dactylosporangium sp. NBC_01737]